MGFVLRISQRPSACVCRVLIDCRRKCVSDDSAHRDRFAEAFQCVTLITWMACFTTPGAAADRPFMRLSGETHKNGSSIHSEGNAPTREHR